MSKVGAAALLAVMVFAACGASERIEPTGDTADWTELTIARGTVGRAGDLSIGVTGVRERGGSPGTSQQGSVAQLAFFVPGEPRREERRDMEPGQRDEILGYPVLLVEVRKGGLGDAFALPGSSGGQGATIRVGRARLSAQPCPRSSAPPQSSGPARHTATIDPRPVVCPTAVTLRVGEVRRFTAAQQESGRSASIPRVTWSVSPSSLGTITADGIFTATSVGTGAVTAPLSGSPPLTGSASITPLYTDEVKAELEAELQDAQRKQVDPGSARDRRRPVLA